MPKPDPGTGSFYAKRDGVRVYERTGSLPKPCGVVTMDGQECADTYQCVHCGRHWIWVRGSGRKHKWCINCCGYTCSSKTCMEGECVPWQKRLELVEKGKIAVHDW